MLWNRLFWNELEVYSVYGDEDDNGGGGEPPPATPPATPPTPTNQDVNPKTGKLFTQDEVNRIAAENKRALQAANKQHLAELEQLRKAKGLTEKEKDALTSRIEELQASMMTKEELARKDANKQKREYEEKLKEVTGQRDYFQQLFQDSTIEREISDAATASGAYNSRQVVNLLKQSARLVEVTDEDGNVIPGKHAVKIKLSDKDAAGKATVLDLDVPEALKRMKDDNEQWGNLFKNNLTAGLGDKRSEGGSKPPDVRKMTPEQYRIHRAEEKKRGNL